MQNIIGSPNIAILDTKIVGDVCAGKILVDVSPSTFIGAGYNNVLGAKIKVVNQSGVTIKDYTATYDITPPMTSIASVNLPLLGNGYDWGIYTVSLELTDANGSKKVETKTINICQSDSTNKDKKFGTIHADVKADCKNSKNTILVNEPPIYKTLAAESYTSTLVITNPNGGIINSTVNSFSTLLIEGVWKISGDICATYNLGNNKFTKIPYKVKFEKNVKCRVSKCCIAPRIKQLDAELKSCNKEHQDEIGGKIFHSLKLLFLIDSGTDCGEDVSSEIEELETLLDIKCLCGIDNSPIINATPAKDILIEGCGFSKTTVGTTDIYTLNNTSYTIEVNPTQVGLITISGGIINGCTSTQTLSVNAAAWYQLIKNQINNSTEYNFWTNIVKNGFTPTNANLTCLGLTLAQYTALTYNDFWNLVLSKICNCLCKAPQICPPIASPVPTSTNIVNAVCPYNLIANLPSAPSGLTYEVHSANNTLATTLIATPTAVTTGVYYIFLKDANGCYSDGVSVNVNCMACPTIAPPIPIQNNIVNANCPYNALTNLPTAPSGLTYEFHDANNTLAQSLITNIISGSGTFYVFLKDANGCYSSGVPVNITCAASGNCTAPLNLVVTETNSGALIEFSAAAIPPPLNSYIVYRSPSGTNSYTVLGTPTYNSGTSKYEFTDTTLLVNKLYDYKAESQCSDGSRPFIIKTFAKITCPTLNTTTTTNSISYSFVPIGGDITKVEVIDQTAAVTNTHLAPFSNPTNGNFAGLVPNTLHNIVTKVYIGTYVKTCPLIQVLVTAGIANCINIPMIDCNVSPFSNQGTFSTDYNNNQHTFNVVVDSVTAPQTLNTNTCILRMNKPSCYTCIDGTHTDQSGDWQYIVDSNAVGNNQFRLVYIGNPILINGTTNYNLTFNVVCTLPI